MKKKSIVFIIITILSITLVYGTNKVKADSGWDYDYDYGGSWGSGYDYNYDYDYDYSYDYDYGGSWNSNYDYDRDYGSGNTTYNNSTWLEKIFSFIGFIFPPIVLIIIYILAISLENHKEEMKKDPNKIEIKTNPYNELPEEQIVAKLGITSSELKRISFDIYKNIQNAWTEFDYKKLHKYTTNELYNTYVMQLDVLKSKNQKNIMTDIEYIDAKIIEIKEENDIISINVYMNIKMYDYIVGNNEHVVRGTKRNKANIEYILTFVKVADKASKKETKCPTCGAEIKTNTSGKCTHCRNLLITKPKKLVLSKKTCIGQRME